MRPRQFFLSPSIPFAIIISTSPSPVKCGVAGVRPVVPVPAGDPVRRQLLPHVPAGQRVQLGRDRLQGQGREAQDAGHGRMLLQVGGGASDELGKLRHQTCPTNNRDTLSKLPTELRCRNFSLIIADRACKSVAKNVQKRVCIGYMFRPSFYFAHHRWWLGRTCENVCAMCAYCSYVPTELPFCIPPLVVGKFPCDLCVQRVHIPTDASTLHAAVGGWVRPFVQT